MVQVNISILKASHERKLWYCGDRCKPVFWSSAWSHLNEYAYCIANEPIDSLASLFVLKNWLQRQQLPYLYFTSITKARLLYLTCLQVFAVNTYTDFPPFLASKVKLIYCANLEQTHFIIILKFSCRQFVTLLAVLLGVRVQCKSSWGTPRQVIKPYKSHLTKPHD